MLRNKAFLSVVVVFIAMAFGFVVYWKLSDVYFEKPVVIRYPENASQVEKFAAHEIRRYLYLRTGKLAKFHHRDDSSVRNSFLITLGTKNWPGTHYSGEKADLDAGEYIIRKSLNWKGIHIIGGDDISTLYGAYRYAEHLGVRFYLHGDVVPDGILNSELPEINEKGKPLFETRGIQPFHDFPEGPDWWNLDDYKSVIAQLPKLRMNFFGLHTYPEGHPNAEPTVWIGLKDDIGQNGTVTVSYSSSYQNTLRGNWGYSAKPTSEFLFGGSQLFARDDYGNDVMAGMCPQPESPDDCNEVFRRAGTVLGDVFGFAHTLGIKTCIGTETPLRIPERVQERLRSMGKNPADPTVVQELYEGMFRRVADTTPIDYYWFWTPEGWTWSGNTDEQMQATLSDFRAALAAKEKTGAQFELATCGWVLGPLNDRAFFDDSLPKSMPMSCINRGVGSVPVDRAFARVTGRPLWAIPWLEDDPALTSPQLWVGRMRCDAADALRYGCTGLLGIHWRTRILGPNAAALAHAAWDQKPWIDETRASGALDGSVVPQSNKPVAGTDDDILYQTARHNVFNYRFVVPDGEYTVTLKFCELEEKKKGERVFDVYFQGEKLAEKLDIVSRAGRHRALDLSFESIKVGDGSLEITFEPLTGVSSSSLISAIEIMGGGISRKINCGGPEHNGYTADTGDVWDHLPARHMPSIDFYEDWSLHQFGPEAAPEIAAIFERMDGGLPRSSNWIHGPGGWKPDTVSWEERAGDYRFVGELEQLRDRVAGKGNLDRFDYWLNSFMYMRSSAHLCCVWRYFNGVMTEVKKEQDKDTARLIAREDGITFYHEMVTLAHETYNYLLATVSNTGEMGTIANLEQHIFPGMLTETRKQLEEALGNTVPDYALVKQDFTGKPRVIVPTVRTSYTEGETISLKVIILDSNPPQSADLFWREMGKGKYKTVPLSHVSRGVYSVRIPAQGTDVTDLEYYVRVVTENGKNLHFPATAPEMNQTVVMMGK